MGKQLARKPKGCSFPECPGKHEAHGLCSTHYKRTPEYRQRNRRREKDRRDSDPVYRKAYNDRSVAFGKKLRADPVRGPKIRAEDRKRYQESAEERLLQQIRLYTGFTSELIESVRLEQGGKCQICTTHLTSKYPGYKAPRTWYAHRECKDHFETRDGKRCTTTKTDSSVKYPRGLLCGPCNSALGFYEKFQRPAGLRIDVYETYLAKYSTVHFEAK